MFESDILYYDVSTADLTKRSQRPFDIRWNAGFLRQESGDQRCPHGCGKADGSTPPRVVETECRERR